MRIFGFYVLFLFFISCSSLQDIIASKDVEDVPKDSECILERKHKNTVKRAVNYIQQARFDKSKLYDAMDLLRGNDNVHFLALRTEIYSIRENQFKVQEEGLKVIDICPEGFPKVYYLLGEIAFDNKDYVNATRYFQKSLDLNLGDPYYSDAVMFLNKSKIVSDIINNPVSFNPIVVKGISTKHDEYLPVLSPDQDLVFFTRRSIKQSKQYLTPTTVEEFVGSEKNNQSFDVGEPLGYPFNLETNEGGASITNDNKILYYTKCINERDGYRNCDIYYAYRFDSTWSEVQEFSNQISSSKSWESQPTVSSDGATIIFASDRSGGFGETDLYEINLVNGVWSKPNNLGANINSAFHEKSPYLHADNNTLFFSSTNSPSVGGFDIFYSKRDSFGNWGRPINIGYPINTIYDETSLFVSTDGKKAYFASNQLNGVGGWDIYEFLLHEEARPDRVLFIKGDLYDENSHLLDDVEVEVRNIRTNKVTVIKSDKGRYVSSLTLGREDDVLVTIKKKGYAFNSVYISSSDTMYNSPKKLDIQLESIEEGKSFKIDDIYFENNSFEINAIAREVLLAFSSYLKLNNELIIEINGFTDNIGNQVDNQLLSQNRAKSVYDLIVSDGVKKERISYNGYGETFPVADNNTEEGRSKNRRTEFKIISE